MRFDQKRKVAHGITRLDANPVYNPSADSPYTQAVFNEKILDHFRNPRHAGDLPGASATVQVSNPVCGDVLRLSVRVEAGRITDAAFKTQGCVAAIAASSVLTELLLGKLPEEARRITPEQISDALDGLPPATFHAAQLCADGISALLPKLRP
jgi:nitrogen fixation protein NifU and related proteins